MRCPTGLIRVTLAMTLFVAGGACAQGEVAAPVPPQPSPSLNTMPHWSEFPVVPTDVPSALDIKARVEGQVAFRDQLRTQYSALKWDAFQPDVMAAAIQANIDPTKLVPVDPALNSQQLDSLGAALRAKAAPPPLAD